MTNQFQVYAPLKKTIEENHKLNEDGTLTITGVASTTNKDLTGDVINASAILSMKEQAVTKNLHLDHKYGLDDGLIGTITEVLDTDDDTLAIQAKILSKFAPEIKEMLDIGINLGFSIGGSVTDYTPIDDGGWQIDGFNLLEISLTSMPANWDTFGTITSSKGVVKSKCLSGACVELIKNYNEENFKMSEENNNNNNTVSEEAVEQMITDKFNELMSEKQEEIVQETVEMVKDKIGAIVDEKLEEIKNNTPKEEEEETTEDEGEEKQKSIEEIVSKAMAEQMQVFFKNLNDTREPESKFKAQNVPTETTSNDGEAEPMEIAKMMCGSNNDAIVNHIVNNI